MSKVLQAVSAHEGPPDATNLNTDNNGLSFGMIQWSQRSGNLGKLLQKMRAADPTTFDTIFGPKSQVLINSILSGSLEPVDGAVLWESPWVSRFKAAGKYPPFIAVQEAMAKAGTHWQAAEQIAGILGVRTERAMALFFDRAVQQGEGGAPSIAREVKKKYGGGRPSYQDILKDFANTAAWRFRRLTAPEQTKVYDKKTGKLVRQWEQVGPDWRAFAMPDHLDLFKNIQQRCQGILTDPSLGDTAVV